jgi:hypothetical protein
MHSVQFHLVGRDQGDIALSKFRLEYRYEPVGHA